MVLYCSTVQGILDLEFGLLNEANQNESPLTSNCHNSTDIPLKTFHQEEEDNAKAGVIEDVTEREEIPLVRTEFDELQAECDEREKELIEAGQRTLRKLKITRAKCKISTVSSFTETLKAGRSSNNQDMDNVKYEPKWTALHLASAKCIVNRVKELVDAGNDPNVIDDRGRTALDVAGIAFYQGMNIINLPEVLKILLQAGGKFNTMKGKIDSLDTPIHTAVELNCLESIKILLQEGASVACLNSAGLTPPHISIKHKFDEALKILLNYHCEDIKAIAQRANVRDISGFTLLQAAVVTEWMPGVNALLAAGADVIATSDLPFDFYNNVIIEDASKFIYRLEQLHETPVHLAADTGNRHILRKLINKKPKAVNHFNYLGQSPLYIAIRGGYVDCTDTLLNLGADILKVSKENQNALHVAIQFGFEKVAEFLLEHFDSNLNLMMNSFDNLGYAPIHTAVASNRVDCIEILSKKHAFLRLKTKGWFIANWTPLHIAAAKNYPEAAEVILRIDEKAIEDVDHIGRSPIHLAASRCNREVMVVMLRKGAVLSSRTKRERKTRYKDKKDVTALEMISTELPNPSTFFEEVFDSFIDPNDSDLNEEYSGSLVTIDYGVFTKVDGISQIKVLEELVKCDQRRTLIHPLVESLIYLKWRSLLPFFVGIVLIYLYFALSLFAVIIDDFYDENRENKYTNCTYLVAPLILIILLEAFFINVHRTRYFWVLENWAKLFSILFAIILLFMGYKSWTESEWSRHVATVALLLSWIQIMFLLSRFPYMGIYVLMFGKVSANIFKILFIFCFVLIVFSMSFMIQYHSNPPFDGPWAALMKTIVMMTSEFEYENLFGKEHSKELADSKIFVNIIFILFLLFVSIVFVNFMVGIAVSDINDLKTDGDIGRLEKQVEYLCTLDVLAFGFPMRKILSKDFINNRFIKEIKIKAGVTKYWVVIYETKGENDENQLIQKEIVLPSHILDNIFEKIKTKKEQKEEERKTKLYRMQVDMLYKTIVGNEKLSSNKIGREIDLLHEIIQDGNKIKHKHNFKIKNDFSDKSTQTDSNITENVRKSL